MSKSSNDNASAHLRADWATLEPTHNDFGHVVDDQCMFRHTIEKCMKPTLQKAIEQRDKKYTELLELEQTELSIKALELTLSEREAQGEAQENDSPAIREKTPLMETRVNIGEEFYMRANVYDADAVFVDVGFDIMVEMSLSEASAFFSKRKALLQAAADRESKTITEIQEQLEQMASYLTQLNKIEAKATKIV